MNEFKYIDLFAGCGGLSLGLHNAGLKALFAIEKNDQAFMTLEHNLINKKEHFDWPDWLASSPHDINELLINNSDELVKLKGSVSLVVGGPPCQGFSTAGRRDAKDDRNKLINSYISFIDKVQPNALFLENVNGITMKFSQADAYSYAQVLEDKLTKMGYRSGWTIINMSNFGVPQCRQRFILVALKDKNPKIFFERLFENKHDFLQEKKLLQKHYAKHALSDLLRSNGEAESPDTPSFNAGIYGNIETKYQSLMRKGVSRTQPADSHRFTKHTEEIIELHNDILQSCSKGEVIKSGNERFPKLRRRNVTVLNPDGFAPTITSSPDEILHYSEPRILTVREMARLQSFPDWFEFKGKYTTGGQLRKIEVPRYTQVANAVPPLFAEQVGVVFNELLKG